MVRKWILLTKTICLPINQHVSN